MASNIEASSRSEPTRTGAADSEVSDETEAGDVEAESARSEAARGEVAELDEPGRDEDSEHPGLREADDRRFRLVRSERESEGVKPPDDLRCDRASRMGVFGAADWWSDASG